MATPTTVSHWLSTCSQNFSATSKLLQVDLPRAAFVVEPYDSLRHSIRPWLSLIQVPIGRHGQRPSTAALSQYSSSHGRCPICSCHSRPPYNPFPLSIPYLQRPLSCKTSGDPYCVLYRSRGSRIRGQEVGKWPERL